MTDAPAPRRRPGRRRRVANTVAIGVVTLALAEVLLRFTDFGPPGQDLSDPITHLYLPPPGSGVVDASDKLNSWGFRGRDPAVPTPGARRIAAIGDSFTYGYRLPLGDGWVERLEPLLDRAAVFNLGLFGLNACQERLLAERFLPRLPTDVVVLQQFANDTERQRQNPPVCGPCLSGCSAVEALGEELAFETRLGWAVFHAADGWRSLHPPEGMRGDRWRGYHPDGLWWRSYGETARRFAELSRRLGTRLVVAWVPDLDVGGPHGGDAATCRRVEAVWQALDVPFLDLHDAIGPDPGNRLRVGHGDPHFGAEGNARIAAAIAAFLVSQGLATPAATPTPP